MAATAAGIFLPYQQKWLNDPTRFKIWEKSRRIGATWAQAYEDVQDILMRKEYTSGRPVTQVFLSSADESAAREYIKACAMWAKAFNAVAETFEAPLLDEDNIFSLCIKFDDTRAIYAMTSSPKRFRSKGGKIILDEFAWHEDQPALWAAAKPSATWGYPIRILSTHHGKQSLFYKFVSDVKNGRLSWSLHTTDIFTAVKQGLVDKIAGRKLTKRQKQVWIDEEHKNCVSEDIWQEEYCCNAVDSVSAFLPYELIHSVEDSRAPMMSIDELCNISNPLYMGWDIARKRHYSVMWVAELYNSILFTRYIKDFQNVRYQQQIDHAAALLKRVSNIRRAAIDNTGMGGPIAEALQDKFGIMRVEAVTMTSAVKEELATSVYEVIEDSRCRIPATDLVRESFHSVRKIVTPAGNIRFDADATDLIGHADHFWAFALCTHAAKQYAGPITVKSRNRWEKYRGYDMTGYYASQGRRGNDSFMHSIPRQKHDPNF